MSLNPFLLLVMKLARIGKGGPRAKKPLPISAAYASPGGRPIGPAYGMMKTSTLTPVARTGMVAMMKDIAETALWM
ncbi:hypothetical protein [Neorhizobium sp. T25_27]|uniref:hypothetical protein n=1 Tax=Neorhizobium sp. T25_27 TaxID=2093831 RepID=UPI00155EB595|nr:hypothetical protein [Neorhizobium sp. T25_27]